MSEILKENSMSSESMAALKVADLKVLLKKRGLKVSGKKAELIDRLREQSATEAPESTTNKEPNIKNKGTGAGGSNTNGNGLPYEGMTELDDRITIMDKKKDSPFTVIKFNGHEKLFVKTKQAQFFKYMKDETDKEIKQAHGCKKPDECYIDEELKIIFIIEKKFQQTNGSVCEKIQTPDFKLWQYSRTFPDYTIVYIYCLSDWFKTNCISELEYLDIKKVPYFWGSSETYKDEIIKFMLNYNK